MKRHCRRVDSADPLSIWELLDSGPDPVLLRKFIYLWPHLFIYLQTGWAIAVPPSPVLKP